MNRNLSAAILAAALIGAISSTTGVAIADGMAGAPGVTQDRGDIAFGYNDGYWDRSHQWHVWRDQDEMKSYKSAQNNQFHDWQHSRDPDQGWIAQ